MSPRAVRKKKSQTATVWSNVQTPLRIVPLHPAARAAAVGTPQMTYRGGPLHTAVEVFTIFWVKAWQDAANATLLTKMNDFFDYILTSKLMNQLAEYSVAGQTIGPGKRIGTLNLVSSEPGSSVQDSDIQAMVQNGIAAGTLPPKNANSLYFVFLPLGTQVTQGGSASCKDFCGYHDSTADQTYYAVMPYPGCTGCEGGLAIADALTSTSSHELCEAITDPIPGQGWYDDSYGEFGDICAWNTKSLGACTVQLVWSYSADACVCRALDVESLAILQVGQLACGTLYSLAPRVYKRPSSGWSRRKPGFPRPAQQSQRKIALRRSINRCGLSRVMSKGLVRTGGTKSDDS